MKKELIVIGSYKGNLHDGVMEWDCPFTNEPKSAWGQFEVSDDAYVHKVYANDDLAYTVIANETKNTKP